MNITSAERPATVWILVAVVAVIQFVMIFTGCESGIDHERIDCTDCTVYNGTEPTTAGSAKGSSHSEGSYGGTLHLPWHGTIPLHPYSRFRTTHSIDVSGLMYEGLTGIDPVTRNAVAHCADRWSVSEDSLQWTFHLKKDLLWSDTTALSAFDVVYTYTHFVCNSRKSPASPWRRIYTFGDTCITVQAVDSHTVVFRLPFPIASFARMASFPILPRHEYSQRESTSSGVSLPLPSVGSGPFLLRAYVPDVKAIFVRNPLYFKKDSNGKKLPYLDSVVYMYTQSRYTPYHAFLEHDLDYLAAGPDLFDTLTQSAAQEGFSVYTWPCSKKVNYLIFNQSLTLGNHEKTNRDSSRMTSLLRMQQFRQALAHCVDVSRYIDSAYSGKAVLQRFFVAQDSNALLHNPQYRYSLSRARQLLDGLGLKDSDNDGVREDTAGVALSLKLYTNSENTARRRMARNVCERMQKCGIDAQCSYIPFSQLRMFLADSSFLWHAAITGFTRPAAAEFSKALWGGKEGVGFPGVVYDGKKGDIQCPDAESLFVEALQTKSPQKRAALLQRIESCLIDKAALVTLPAPQQYLCIDKRLKNVTPSFRGGLLHNIEWIYEE